MLSANSSEEKQMAEPIEQTFDTPQGCDLVVRNVKGTISIQGWDRAETQVVAQPHQEWGRVKVYQEGRTVVAETLDTKGEKHRGLATTAPLPRGRLYDTRSPRQQRQGDQRQRPNSRRTGTGQRQEPQRRRDHLPDRGHRTGQGRCSERQHQGRPAGRRCQDPRRERQALR